MKAYGSSMKLSFKDSENELRVKKEYPTELTEDVFSPTTTLISMILSLLWKVTFQEMCQLHFGVMRLVKNNKNHFVKPIFFNICG